MRIRVSAVVMITTMMAIGSAVAEAQSGADEKKAHDDATVAAPVGSRDHPDIVSPGVMAGLILHKVDPVYPEDARDVSGSVILLTTIDDKGKIANLSVIAGPEKLRDAALKAVKQWTYKPYLLNGNPVYVKTQITITFSITAGKVPTSARPN